MSTENQAPVIDFLSRPTTHSGSAVERIDTHASIVFLAGPLAYKLKRAVRFDYLDFSSVDRRRASREAEVHLNQRMAPSIYRGVVPVTVEAGGSYALGGSGAPQDWLVAMNRFPQERCSIASLRATRWRWTRCRRWPMRSRSSMLAPSVAWITVDGPAWPGRSKAMPKASASSGQACSSAAPSIG